MLATETPTTTIRLGTEAEIPALVAMGLRFIRETEYRDSVPENPSQLRWLCWRLISAEDATMLVADRGGILIGMIGLVLFVHPLTGEQTAQVLTLWVEPEFRGAAGVWLVNHAERWAKAHGAVEFQASAAIPRTEQFYQRLKFTALERVYRKRLSDA